MGESLGTKKFTLGTRALAQAIQYFKDRKFVKVEDLEVGKVYNFEKLEFIKTQYGRELTGNIDGDKPFIFPSYIQKYFEDTELRENVSFKLKYMGFIASGKNKISEFDIVRD